MSAFEHVGPHIDLSDIRITADDAERFRTAVLAGTSLRDLVKDDHHTSFKISSMASGDLSDGAGDYNVSERYYAAKSTYESSMGPLWHVHAMFGRYKPSDRETKIYNHYTVEMFDGTVTSAVRYVRILRSVSQIAFNADGLPYTDFLKRDRKVFERPMEPADIDRVSEAIGQITARQRVRSAPKIWLHRLG